MGTTCQNPVSFSLLSLFFIFFSLAFFCHAAAKITKGQSIRDGETIVSAGGNFKLGFFSSGNSTSRYVGIWYNKIPVLSVVWVANREKPISDRTGVLRIGCDGNLMVSYGRNESSLWSSNASVLVSNNTEAILLDTGNLVLSSSQDVGDTSKAYWQSFTNPTDTYLPGMKVPVNVVAGENRVFTSWKSASDPSPGSYSMGVDPRGSPQIVIWEGMKRRWRSGHWNAVTFTGVPNMTANYLHGFKLSSPERDGSMYFSYVPPNSSDTLRFRIGWNGNVELLNWDEIEKEWSVVQSQPDNDCELYNRCGHFGVCNVQESPICSCMEGFEPRDVNQWNRGNWSGGCVRRTQLQCGRKGNETDENGRGDGFKEMRCVKLPDFVDSVSEEDKEGCKKKCLKNCSCNAYASITGIGCMIWSGDLVDVQHLDKGGSNGRMRVHIRLAASELGGKGIISRVVIVTIIIVGAFLIMSISIWLLWSFRTKLKASSISWWKKIDIPMFESSDISTDLSGPNDLIIEVNHLDGPELPLFNFRCVATATDNFSEENKLGQGGFGPVYKGKLPGEQEIAVKRLSSWSGQGLEEFKNELILIAKLQHRNLVRLLGCCIQGEEKMLLYEYMPNKSLDCLLFDPTKQALLDWRKRFTIIEGIARGLLYLHRDSRLRIIHRDLKASNVLLDKEMNPKISDFGMARIFGGNQNEANTQRLVGTFGYMSPEYAMEGLFSVKSDVYSFGVLLLEIVSGKRNISFHLSRHTSLIAYAWHLWNSGQVMELIDPSIADSCYQNEVLRCIHVGMLCLQDSAVYRPTMSSVVLMLGSEAATLPLPRPSAFASTETVDTKFCLEGHDTICSNDVTMVVGR